MGRPEKKIDWALVDELLLAGCDGPEIAPHFDMHVQTFYERIKEKYNTTFTLYAASKNTQGCSILRHKQFKKAIKNDGDTSMLQFLGRHRLKQIEKEEVVVDEDIKKELNQIQQLLSQLQSARKTEISKVVSDDKSESVAADDLA